MNERIKRIKERAVTSTFPLCIERLRIAFDTLEATKGQPIVKVRAQVQADLLDRMPIFIEPDDLVCGVGASKPNGIEMDYEYGPWSQDEIDGLKAEGLYVIDPDDEKELYSLIERFEKGNLGVSHNVAVGEILGDDARMWPFMKCGLVLPPWKSKRGSGGGKAQSGMGLGPGGYLMVIDYERILNEGARSIINACRKQLEDLHYFESDSIEKKRYWESVITVFEAWIRFANRYADLAEEMAESEIDPKRRKELLLMSQICRRVPEYPAGSFREAVQSFWFAFLLTAPSPVSPGGRFDQFMYPFYKADIEAGNITRDEALELLEILRFKDFQLNRVSGGANRQKNAGMAKWHNWTIGGQDSQGRDAVNDLTYLEMEAAKDTLIPHHTITLRVHKDTDLKTIVKGLEVVQAGAAMPAFISDDSYIKFFLDKGLSIEDARNYCLCGCLDGVIPGVTRVQAAPCFVVALAYDIFLHNGFCGFTKENVGIKTGEMTDFATFDEYKAAFLKQMHYLIGLAAEKLNVEIMCYRDLLPDLFRSALIRNGIESGREMMWRHIEPYDCICAVSAVGVINVADSLAAVKTLVYDQKKYSMSDLMKALDANWEGYEEMRADFSAAPKYGNNLDLPDSLAAELYDAYAKSLMSYPTPTGGVHIPNAISITSHQPGGFAVGALPDGRKAHEILADGSMSPAQGRDVNGPLAVLESAMKIDQDSYQATLLNMKFHPSALKTEEDLYKLASMVKTYLTHGGKHIQFNIVSREKLEAAKKDPDSNRDLIVRVAGYSAYFTLLSNKMQNEIIDRTTHML